MSYTQLHAHNSFSLLDGLGTPEQFAKKANELGYKYLAVTNHGSVDGVIKFQKACLDNNITPIIGIEFYIVPDGIVKEKEKRGHLTAWIKNQTGYENVLKMVTISNLDLFYRRPRIDYETLLNHCEGLCIGTACSASFLNCEGGVDFFHKLHDKIKDDLYLEIMPHDYEDQHKINELCLNLHKETGVKLIVTNDCHYVNAEDSESHEVLLACQTKAKWNDPKRWRFNVTGLYLCEPEFIANKFKEQDKIEESIILQAMDNTQEICEKCEDFRIDRKEIILPLPPQYEGMDEEQVFRDLCEEGFKNKFDVVTQEYRDRFEYEFSVIKDFGIVRYFLIVADLINWCEENDILVGGGRGCLTKDTLVLTKDQGFVTLDKISIGDFVYSHTGNVQKITNTMRYDVKNEKLIEFKTNYAFKTIKLTKDHKVFAVKAEETPEYSLLKNTNPKWAKKIKRWKSIENPQWIKAEDLKECDYIFNPWPNRDVMQPKDIDLGLYTKIYQVTQNHLIRNLPLKNDLSLRTVCKKLGFSRNFIRDFNIEKINTIGENNIKRADEYLSEYNLNFEEWMGLDNTEEIKIDRFIKFDEDFSYFLGLWIGNGWYKDYDNGYYVGLCFNNTHERKINWLRNYLKRYNFRYSERISSGKDLIQIYIYCDALTFYIKEVFPDYKLKSYTKYIGDFKYLPSELLRSLLSGLQDTDGHIARGQSKECIDTTSPRLMLDIKESLLYLKVPSSVRVRKEFLHGEYLCRESYKICFLGFKEDRKKKSPFIKEDGYYSKILKVSEVSEDYVYDITVENESSYMTSNFAVHNSSAGCLCSYLMNIVKVDPIKYGLLFERFLNPARKGAMADIDVDFDSTERNNVINRLKAIYGDKQIAYVSTFLSIEDKTAIRDVSRVFDINLMETNNFSKSIIDDLETALETPDGRNYQNRYPEVVNHALKLKGQIKALGKHASALLVSPVDLTLGTRCALSNRNGNLTVNLDGEDAENQGLIKLDVLGLSTLTVVSMALKTIKQNHGITIDLQKIPLDDKNVYDEITAGNNVGCFQIGTFTLTKLIKDMGVSCIGELSDAVALCRPGPFDSGATGKYIDRKHGSSWEFKHPIYEEITKDTHSIIVYQEQIIQVIHKIAGLSLADADAVRKIVGKKRDSKYFEKYKQSFVDGCLKNETFSEKEADEFWEELKHHASYSFNKSHSLSYSILSYHTAYLKYYYPTEFLCASLTHGSAGMKLDLIKEAQRLNLEIIPPRIGRSDVNNWIAKDGKLYVPFIEIAGIGPKMAETLQNFISFKDDGFFSEKEKPVIKGKLKTILEDIGAFDGKMNDDIDKYFDIGVTFVPKVVYPKLYDLVGINNKNPIYKLLSGDFKARGLTKVASRKRLKGLTECDRCSVRKGCKYPINTTNGLYNVMILNENANWLDEKSKKHCTGDSFDKLVWPVIESYGYEKEDFIKSSIVKCSCKRPGINVIQNCSGWLKEEIKQKEVYLVLSFGNAAVKLFKGEESGIQRLNGTCEWNEEYGCYVLYCVSPFTALMHVDARIMFDHAIKNFVEKLTLIGGFE